MEKFSLQYIRTLNFENAKIYLSTYFTLLSDGSSLFLIDNKQLSISKKITKHVYFNRMSKELNDYYFKQTI